ncbi:MAG: hemolysin III family protein [Emergencia sp.]
MNEHALKRYTVGEEIFNSVSHGAGALLAAGGTAVMAVMSAFHGSGLALGVSLVYGISMIVLYTMSTLYHAVSAPRAKEILRIFDHTSIFLLIAGSYTPFCLIALQGNGKGIGVAVIVWVCAVLGIVLNAVSLEKTAKLSMVLYLAMGWSVIMILPDVVRALPQPAFWLLLLGGISYTGGIVFYAMKKRYMHSIWHLFVLAGSLLHFFCVSIYVLPMAWA